MKIEPIKWEYLECGLPFCEVNGTGYVIAEFDELFRVCGYLYPAVEGGHGIIMEPGFEQTQAQTVEECKALFQAVALKRWLLKPYRLVMTHYYPDDWEVIQDPFSPTDKETIKHRGKVVATNIEGDHEEWIVNHIMKEWSQ